MNTLTATYSPDDNKLRLYSLGRLDADTYARAHAAGFRFAPKQDLFVAPAWTPSREDLLLELCGEIGDEDTGLVERAEARAERFDEYREKRGDEAQAARAAVARIADNIPLGQPILVGHHSERHARKDAERIENGMRRAVRLWETSQYWQARAAGALRHAKYKERPDVRHRRIKTLEADQRRQQRVLDEAQRYLAGWQCDGLSREAAMVLANGSYLSQRFPLADFPRDPPASQYEGDMGLWSALHDGVIDVAQARAICLRTYPATIAHAQRWLAHYAHRIAYERAMLDEQGGIVGERQEIAVGGRVKVRGEWLTVLRVNKAGGRVTSVTTNSRYVRVKGIEEVQEYAAPEAGQAEKVRAATRVAPLANYPGEGFAHITQAQWDRIPKDYRGTETVAAAAGRGRHRVRHAIGAYVLPRGERDDNRRHSYPRVFITDARRVEPPAAAEGAADAAPSIPAPERAAVAARAALAASELPSQEAAPSDDFAALRAQLRAGVQVVSAPQLFPTPPALAARVVDALRPALGARVLEPSAGTGHLLRALPGVMPFGTNRQTWCGEVVAVELNRALCDALRSDGLAHRVTCADFLECEPEALAGDDAGRDPSALGRFDAVLMNPPFARGADIAHIRHAVRFLRPGGRLVAICANGPRQREALLPLVEASGGTWEDLPEGSFEQAGTGVRTALLTIEAPAGEAVEGVAPQPALVTAA
jgi:SAM-dependent methyltransferase